MWRMLDKSSKLKCVPKKCGGKNPNLIAVTYWKCGQ